MQVTINGNGTLSMGLIRILCVISTLLTSGTIRANDAISPLYTPIYSASKQWAGTGTQDIDNPLQDMKVQLGQRLFEDPSLSSSGEMACSTCHQASMGFSDGRDFSLDNQGNPLPFNTPSIEYIAYNYYFGWTGKFPRLQDHLDALMLNPKLMNRDWAHISQELSANEEYKASFQNAGYTEISRSSISDAIIQYEYSLAKPSRYDFYLLGDTQQFSKEERQGYILFKEYGCNSCHQGINLGGNLRQKFGLMKNIFSNEDSIKSRDYGYFTTTQQEEDRFYFRVPSLRNVSNTAPYFHDASAKTLYRAVEIMFVNQLGIKPRHTDLELIIAFLHTLEPSQ